MRLLATSEHRYEQTRRERIRLIIPQSDLKLHSSLVDLLLKGIVVRQKEDECFREQL